MTEENQIPEAHVVDSDAPQPAHCYNILTETASLIGFDTRPLSAIEAEWLAKWNVSVTALTKANFEGAKIHATLHKKSNSVGEDSYKSDEDGHDEICEPKPCSPEKDEILRLSGHPMANGLGAVSVLASSIRAITHAHPAAVVEWSNGVADAVEMQRKALRAATVGRGKAKGKKGKGR